MILWRNNRISDKQHEALLFIYDYRGLTNEHLRKLIFGHLDSDPSGQKANISRYIAGLRKMKMIESHSCYPYSKELIHCLTPKGVEYIKNMVTIDPEHELAGFDRLHYGDFEAAMLKPGLKNIEHTMMYLDFVITYRAAPTRHNLYAVKDFTYYFEISPMAAMNKSGKIRPDGEMLIQNNTFCIEIDTGSERFEQLVAKFNNYKRYFDYCITDDISNPWKGMLFVCKKSTSELSKDKRIQTIIRAVCEGLQNYAWTFPVLIVNRTDKNVNVRNLLIQKAEVIEAMDIPLPSEANLVLEKNKKEEERKKHEEEETIRRREEARFSLENQIKRERMEHARKQMLREERIKREAAEEEKRKNKRFFGIGKMF